MTPKTIDEYIAAFPPEVQAILRKIRATIKEATPDAEERNSYQMPTFTVNGSLVYFGTFKKHIGLYPPVREDEDLMSEISIYEGEKGNLRFPLDQTYSLRLDQQDREGANKREPGGSRY